MPSDLNSFLTEFANKNRGAPQVSLVTGTVISVESATACTVRLGPTADGDVPGVKSLSSYVPTVGDVVRLLGKFPDVFIVGKLGVGPQYLPLSGKAADSDLLDGIDSTGFLRKTPWESAAITQAQGAENTTRLGTVAAANNTLNQHLRSGWYDGVSIAGAPTGDWWLVQVISHSGGSHWQRQIAYSMTSEQGTQSVYSRRCNGGDPTLAASWTAWAPMQQDSGWTELTGFVNGASAYQVGLGNSWTPRYRKVSGIVHLEGLVNAGTTAAVHVCTLPAGFRPGTGVKMVNMFASGPSVRRMDIGTDGAMIFREVVGTASTGWHNIGCSFPQEN